MTLVELSRRVGLIAASDDQAFRRDIDRVGAMLTRLLQVMQTRSKNCDQRL